MTRFLFPVTVVVLAVFAVACGGSGGPETDNGEGASAGTDAPAGLSLILFRDTTRNTVVAHSISDGRRWELSFGLEEFLVAMDCSRDGQRAAYLKSMQGTTSVTLSGAADSPIAVPGKAAGSAWSPDGNRIAVTTLDAATSRNQLLLLDLGSGAQTTSASGRGPIGAPRWSPDGARIAFDAGDGRSNQVFVYTLGDAAATKLAERPQSAFGPDWYPDSAALLFSAPNAAGTSSQIFTIGADGANERQLTSGDVSKGLPRWSPDGSLVAYAGTTVVPTVSRLPALRHNLAVWTMNPDGSAERQLTDLQQDAWLLGWCVSGPWLSEGWKKVD